MTAAAADATVVGTGTAARFELGAGDRIVIRTPDGSQGGDFSFIGFDQAMTRNVNGWDRFGRPYLVFAVEQGMHLCDGDGARVLEVDECRTAGKLDVMLPGCWREIYEDGRPGCRDLISEALGIERREITGMLSFFVDSEVSEDHYDGLRGAEIRPGDFISFRALGPIEAAVSACPDTEIPGWRPGDLEVSVAGGSA